MSTETFESRVQGLVAEGKLTPEEARDLLTGSESAHGSAHPRRFSDANGTARSSSPHGAGHGASAGSGTPYLDAPSVPAAEAPPRLSIQLTNGDVSITGRPGLTEPRLVHATRGLSLRATAHGWIVEHAPVSDLASALDWVRAGISTLAPGSLEIDVPEGFTELEIRALAGDVDVRDVHAHVRVSLTAGDVDLDRVAGFDVTTRTGSVRVRAKIATGRHSIQAYTGDAELQLDPGSSAELELSTLTGRVDARRMTLRRAGVLARTHDARVGDGTARIRLETLTGDVDVRTGWEA